MNNNNQTHGICSCKDVEKIPWQTFDSKCRFQGILLILWYSWGLSNQWLLGYFPCGPSPPLSQSHGQDTTVQSSQTHIQTTLHTRNGLQEWLVQLPNVAYVLSNFYYIPKYQKKYQHILTELLPEYIKNTNTYLQSYSLNTMFIQDWNVVGALVKPKGMTRNSKWP